MIAFSIEALCGEADEDDIFVDDINRYAISVYMHKVSVRSVLSLPLPTSLQTRLPLSTTLLY